MSDLRVYRGPPLEMFDNFESTAKGVGKGTWEADKGWCNNGVLRMVANPDGKARSPRYCAALGRKTKPH